MNTKEELSARITAYRVALMLAAQIGCKTEHEETCIVRGLPETGYCLPCFARSLMEADDAARSR